MSKRHTAPALLLFFGFVCLFSLGAAGDAYAARQLSSGLPVPCPDGTIITGPGMVCGASQKASPEEQAAFDKFKSETNVDAKIRLGVQFDEAYPHSAYGESVDTQLVFLYYGRQNWTSFYAAADRVLARNPNSLTVLRTVGWVIPTVYDAKDAKGPAQLDRAEKYEKRALEIVAARKKPKDMTAADFENEKVADEWQARSALGMIYFRRKAYAESVREFQMAAAQESGATKAQDLYTLGLDFANLNQPTEAAKAFTDCAAASDSAAELCKQAATNPIEEGAFYAFNHEPAPTAQVEAGEKFYRDFPNSRYHEGVASTLVGLYHGAQNWPKFYALSDEVIAHDPDNAPVLTLVGWQLARSYDASDPDAAEKLNKAEKYEQHALELIEQLQPAANMTGEEFQRTRDAQASQAHSGLGTVYFRRGKFAESAAELEKATAQSSDAGDLYLLGIDLGKLNRQRDAAEAFGNCAKIASDIQALCRRDAEGAAKRAVAIGQAPTAPQANAGNTSVAPIAEVADVQAPAAQNTVPAARVPDIPPPAAAQETTPAGTTVLKTETVIVPVRVVVRDNNGRVVTSLREENFKLYQDGKVQQIISFTPFTPPASSNESSPASAAPGGAPSGVTVPVVPTGAPAAIKPAPARRFIAMFFDDVHLYFADMVHVREAADKYLASLQPEDRLAIVTATGKDELDFTGDRGALHGVIAKLQPHPFAGGSMAPSLLKNCPPPMTYTEAYAIEQMGSPDVFRMATADAMQCLIQTEGHSSLPGEADARSAAAVAHIAGEEAIDSLFQRLRLVVRRLSAMPGQRVVVLVSPGFIYGGHEKRFDEITDFAVRSNVVVNTLDAKGMYAGEGKWDPDRFKTYGYGHDLENMALAELADGTGGVFIQGDNDFAGAMRRMSEPPEAYYLLGYSPANLALDGKYHVLKVSLAGGAHGEVQARRGFYAPSRLETAEEAAKREVGDALFSDDEQHALPVSVEAAFAKGEAGALELSVKTKVDVSHLSFHKGAGVNQENLTVAAALFDANGNYVDGQQKTVDMNLKDATLDELSKTGVYVELDFPAVKPGSYTLRTVARDSNDRHLSAANTQLTAPN